MWVRFAHMTRRCQPFSTATCTTQYREGSDLVARVSHDQTTATKRSLPLAVLRGVWIADALPSLPDVSGFSNDQSTVNPILTTPVKFFSSDEVSSNPEPDRSEIALKPRNNTDFALMTN